MKARILIIEDDAEFRYLLAKQLRDEGYEVLWAANGVEGVQMVFNQLPDVVVLDCLMPAMDGWETCRQIRGISNVPILMLSCLKAEMDKVRALELGADDYVTKPVGRREFLARIRANLRRCPPGDSSQVVSVDEWLTVDKAQRVVWVDSRTQELSTMEFRLLECFLDSPNRVLTHQTLLTQVWGWEYADERDYLKVYVHHLRQKIEPDPSKPHYIITERGLGYRFQIPVR
jgi:DNA-binding response OmpR family regulator